VKRDVTLIALNDSETLVLASDNSGGIGLKDMDMVKTPYDVVAYYGFRVAVMECIASGGAPISVILHNFCGDDPWKDLVCGIEKGLQELGLTNIPITGSTESNFSLLQSALGMIVIGKRDRVIPEETILLDQMEFAVIGSPLVGEEVLNKVGEVLPLSLFQLLCRLDHVVILPVGSKGVLHELKVMLGEEGHSDSSITCEVDLLKTSGPSTCILIAFPPALESTIRKQASKLYHPLTWCQALQKDNCP
jgi:hypothetical protein